VGRPPVHGSPRPGPGPVQRPQRRRESSPARSHSRPRRACVSRGTPRALVQRHRAAWHTRVAVGHGQTAWLNAAALADLVRRDEVSPEELPDAAIEKTEPDDMSAFLPAGSKSSRSTESAICTHSNQLVTDCASPSVAVACLPPIARAMQQSAFASRQRPVFLCPPQDCTPTAWLPVWLPATDHRPPCARGPPFCLAGRPADASPKLRSHMSDCLRAVHHRDDNHFEKDRSTLLSRPDRDSNAGPTA
jgi:hypothetical protein